MGWDIRERLRQGFEGAKAAGGVAWEGAKVVGAKVSEKAGEAYDAGAKKWREDVAPAIISAGAQQMGNFHYITGNGNNADSDFYYLLADPTFTPEHNKKTLIRAEGETDQAWLARINQSKQEDQKHYTGLINKQHDFELKAATAYQGLNATEEFLTVASIPYVGTAVAPAAGVVGFQTGEREINDYLKQHGNNGRGDHVPVATYRNRFGIGFEQDTDYGAFNGAIDHLSLRRSTQYENGATPMTHTPLAPVEERIAAKNAAEKAEADKIAQAQAEALKAQQNKPGFWSKMFSAIGDFFAMIANFIGGGIKSVYNAVTGKKEESPKTEPTAQPAVQQQAAYTTAPEYTNGLPPQAMVKPSPNVAPTK